MDTALGGDVTKVSRYRARFAGVFFPGETMVTSLWTEGGNVFISASSKQRGAPVITHAALTLRD